MKPATSRVSRLSALVIATILLLGVCYRTQAQPTPAISDLEAKVVKACEQHDLSAIKSCYDLDGVDPYLVDQHLGSWQEYWNENGKSRWSYEKAEYLSLEQIKADKSYSWENIQSLVQPRKMGEHTYAPNLEVLGFITVHFKDLQGGSIGTMEPVGITSDGTAKIACLHLVP